MEIIYRYTRKQAIEDGVLIDITNTANEAGFKFHTVITATAWGEYVALPEHYSGLQDESGRLWDIVWMALCAVRLNKIQGNEGIYSLFVRGVEEGGDDEPFPVERKMKIHIGPGDEGEPVITLMLPNED